VSFWRLYYHLTWATSHREPWLKGRVKRMVYGTISRKAEELRVLVHQIGNAEDHIHLVVSIPPSISVAHCVRNLKGASSHYVNARGKLDWHFEWQRGYGVVSLGERSLPRVKSYVRNQRVHHAEGTTISYLERSGVDDNVRKKGLK